MYTIEEKKLDGTWEPVNEEFETLLAARAYCLEMSIPTGIVFRIVEDGKPGEIIDTRDGSIVYASRDGIQRLTGKSIYETTGNGPHSTWGRDGLVRRILTALIAAILFCLILWAFADMTSRDYSNLHATQSQRALEATWEAER